MDLSRSLAGLAVVVGTGLVSTPAVHGVHQTSSFDAIVATYLSGDAAAAVEVLAAWPAERVEAAVRDSPDDHDEPWFRAGLVMLHTEAGIRKDTFALARPDVGVWHGAIRDYEVHYRRARLLVNDLIDEARARNLPELLDFCRRWFVVASPWSVAKTSQDAMPDVWDGHPDVLLLEGRHEEYRMGPEINGPPVGFSVARPGEFGRGPRISASHGRFHPIRAADAISRFRRVLEQEPKRAGARLRLGRVLYLLDRSDEAEPELERALADAQGIGDVFSGYLAGLFLGQLHEDAGQVIEAGDTYRTAISIYPDGQTARLALGRLLLLQGASSDGWAAIRLVLADNDRPPSGGDPWYGYGFRQPDWRQSAQLLELRESVRSRRLRTSGDGVRDVLTFDNGVVQTEDAASSAGGLSVALLVDTSFSVIGKGRIDTLVRAAATVTRALMPGDQASLLTFGDEVRLTVGATTDFERIRQELETVRRRATPRRHDLTAMWDAVLAAASLVAEKPGRPVVVLMSDGADNASWLLRTAPFDARWMQTQRKRTSEALQASGVALDVLWVPRSFGALGPMSPADPARAVGGVAFSAADDDLAERVRERLAALRSGCGR